MLLLCMTLFSPTLAFIFSCPAGQTLINGSCQVVGSSGRCPKLQVLSADGTCIPRRPTGIMNTVGFGGPSVNEGPDAIEEAASFPESLRPSSPWDMFGFLGGVERLIDGCIGGQVRWPADQNCYSLLSTGPCSDNEWLVAHREGEQLSLQCKDRPCDEHHALWAADNTCHFVIDAEKVCKKGQHLYNNGYGEGVCDCKLGYFYWRGTGNCYPAYRRGPCAQGQHLVYSAGRVMCARNPCRKDGYVMWPRDRRCYRLDTQGPCYFNDYLTVNTRNGELHCLNNMRHIIRTARHACHAGSYHDHRGLCRSSISAPSYLQSLFYG